MPTITIPAATIELADGERYAGLILNDDGAPSHHLVLLPGEKEGVRWEDAKEWSASIGGELPSRKEQSLLYANLKSEFKPRWYWSGELDASGSDYAWSQTFDSGCQSYGNVNDVSNRARAVRRLPIQ